MWSRRIATRLKQFWSHYLGKIGARLPLKARVKIAGHLPKLGRSLHRESDFIVTDYLGAFKVNVNPRMRAEREMLRGRVDADLRHAIEKYVQPGDVVVDIGANTGAVSFFLAQRVGTAGQVHCFEPGPPFFERLKKNIELNPDYASVLLLYPLGLSDESCHLHWKQDAGEPGKAALLSPQGTKVTVTTLDEVVGAKWLRLNFLKVDVEGMEYEVLCGAKNCLRQYRPVIFFESLMEFESYRGKPVLKHLSTYLRELGYEFFEISPKGKRTPVDYPYFSSSTLAVPVGVKT